MQPGLVVATTSGLPAAMFAAFVFFTNDRTPAPSNASIGGPFQLTAHNGQQVSEQDLLGRPFLVFFGYTHCPDVCHTTLFEMPEILRALPGLTVHDLMLLPIERTKK